MQYFSDVAGVVAFYDEDFHGVFGEPDSLIPADAQVIDPEERARLLRGQEAGKVIALDEDGNPALVEPTPLTPEQQADNERYWRAGQLATTDGVVTRHRDELEDGSETTLTAAQYSELQAYRRALRNWPEAGEFPLIDHRPASPLWLAEQIQ